MSFASYLMYGVLFFGLYTSIFYLLTLFDNLDKIKNPNLKKKPFVSVIVPAYNESKNIEKCIKSLLNLNYDKNKLDIIVVDDGSKDNTYEIAGKFKKCGVRVFRKENGGKASALNFGLSKTKGEFVVGLDADSFVSEDCLVKMLGYFENKNVMAVTPSLRVWRPKNYLQMIQRVEYLVGVFFRKVFSFINSIHVTPGPFTVFRKKFFDKYGGFDEGNITEDIEIALRIQSKGYDIENSIDAEVFTVAPLNVKGLIKQRLRWYTGFLNNVLNYKHLFNPKYGNLAILNLPSAFLGVFFAISLFVYFLYRIYITLIGWFNGIVSVNYNFIPLIKNKLNIFYLHFDFIVILVIISSLLGLIIVFLAKNYSKEKLSIKVHFLWYLIFYLMLFSLWWLLTISYKLVGKRVSWRND